MQRVRLGLLAAGRHSCMRAHWMPVLGLEDTQILKTDRRARARRARRASPSRQKRWLLTHEDSGYPIHLT